MKHVSLQAGDTSLLHSTLHFRTGMRYLKQLRFQDFSNCKVLDTFYVSVKPYVKPYVKPQKTALPRSQGSSFRGFDRDRERFKESRCDPSDLRKFGLLGLAVLATRALCWAPDGKAPKTWATKAAPNFSPVTLFLGCFGMKNR